MEKHAEEILNIACKVDQALDDVMTEAEEIMDVNLESAFELEDLVELEASLDRAEKILGSIKESILETQERIPLLRRLIHLARKLPPCTKGHSGSTEVVYAGVTDSGRPYYQCQGCGAVIYG